MTSDELIGLTREGAPRSALIAGLDRQPRSNI
jgi:hypothetical protein